MLHDGIERHGIEAAEEGDEKEDRMPTRQLDQSAKKTEGSLRLVPASLVLTTPAAK